MRKMKKLFFVTLTALSVFSLTLTACGESSVTEIRHADADSVEILGTQSTFAPGDYTLEAKVKPKQAEQGVKWSLVGEVPKGVSFSGDVLTIGSNAEDGAVITVRATSTYDTSIYVTRSYTLEIPEIKGTPIYTETELRAIDDSDESRSGSYILMNDIVLTEPWEPIGVSEKEDDYGTIIRQAQPFNGVLDGNGYTISNIQFENTTTEDGQVIGFIEQIGGSGEVKNLGLQGSFTVHSWSAGIAAINYGIISNCWCDIDVTCTGPAAGALVSDNRGRVEYCYATGKIESGNANASQRSAGLFVNAGDAYSCFGDKDTMGTDNYQTLVGAIKNSDIMLSTSAMKTASTFKDWDTSIWSITNGNYPQLINENFEGGGEEAFISITDNAENIEVSSVYDYQITAEVSGVEDKTVEFKLASSVDGVSIDQKTGLLTFDVTKVEDGCSLTIIASIKSSPDTQASKTYVLWNNDFDITNIYHVYNEYQLYRVATESKFLSGDIILENDIVLDEYSVWPGIGTAATPFTGTFNGNGYTISGLEITGGVSSGFFTCIQAPTKDTVAVKELKIVGSMSGSASWAGAMVGLFQCGTIENCIADVDITTEARLRIGGFVGVNSEDTAPNKTVIRHCIAVGKLSGSSETIGAFAAANNATLEYCFADAVSTGAVKFVSFSNIDPDTCALYSDLQMRTASTFTNDMLSDEIWYKQDASWPTLKNADFVAPETEVYLYIDFNGVLDVYTDPTYQLSAKQYYAEDVSATFTLKEAVAGVSISEKGLLTFTDAFVVGSSVTVVANYQNVVTEKIIRTTSSAPLAISNEDELYALTQAGADLSRGYYLTNNIVLSKYADWPGIPAFSGTFDGRGYTISGLNSTTSGLFTTLEAASADTVIIKNLKVEGTITLSGSSWVGGLAGFFNVGIVENCIIDVDISATSGAIGLAFGCIIAGSEAGPNGDRSATFRNSIILGESNTANYEASGWQLTIGAIGGAVNGIIENVYYCGENVTAAMTNGLDIDSCAQTREALQSAALYSEFDTDIWLILDGQYPSLKA